MKSNFYIAIMAGGSGTRLWPISRCDKPKQFHNLCDTSKSLIQETYERFLDVIPKKNIYISLVKDILDTTKGQLKDIKNSNYIIEPETRNTAPAIALVAAKLLQTDSEAIVAAVPSDHTILKIKNFQNALLSAYSFVEKNPDYLVTLGIKPDSPHTGYGYIKSGRKFKNSPAHEALKFVEKPNLKKAKEYLKNGAYFWNAGYFVFRADKLLLMYQKYAPEIYHGIMKMVPNFSKPKEDVLNAKIYAQLPKMPIDIAIAEKTKKIAVIPADLGWSDVGSWSSLYDLLASNKNGGVVSRGHHLGLDDKNCLVYAQDKLLATIGLENIIIIDTPDVTLVCHKDKSQDVKHLIEKLKKEGMVKYL